MLQKEPLSILLGKIDTARWIVTYLGKHSKASFTLATEALGLPIVECMDGASAEVM